MKKIGFIGVGIMGKSMVRNLMKKQDMNCIFTQEQKRKSMM